MLCFLRISFQVPCPLIRRWAQERVVGKRRLPSRDISRLMIKWGHNPTSLAQNMRNNKTHLQSQLFTSGYRQLWQLFETALVCFRWFSVAISVSILFHCTVVIAVYKPQERPFRTIRSNSGKIFSNTLKTVSSVHQTPYELMWRKTPVWQCTLFGVFSSLQSPNFPCLTKYACTQKLTPWLKMCWS